MKVTINKEHYQNLLNNEIQFIETTIDRGYEILRSTSQHLHLVTNTELEKLVRQAFEAGSEWRGSLQWVLRESTHIPLPKNVDNFIKELKEKGIL